MIDLKSVVEKYPECLDSATKFKSYMMDLYPDNSNKARIRILADIVDCGIALEIKNGKTDNISISNFCNTMENQYGYSVKLVEECINQFVIAFGFETKSSFVKIETDENKSLSQYPIESSYNIKNCDASDFKIENGVLIKYGGNNKEVIIPEGVVHIANHAFADCSFIESITMPKSLKSIGAIAFYKSVRKWDKDTEEYHSYKAGLNIPKINIKDISNWCEINGEFAQFLGYDVKLYLNDTLIENLIIPEGVTQIASSAFYYFSNIKNVTLPSSVKKIGYRAFTLYGLNVNITDIVTWCEMDKGNWNIHYNLFVNELPIPELVLPNTLVEIKEKTFYGCQNIKSVTLPNSILSVGESCFEHCSNLTSVKIGKGITTISDSMFKDCVNLSSIEFPNSVTNIGKKSFENCKRIRSITLPNSVRIIDNCAFAKCYSLNKINIPHDIENIAHNIFLFCQQPMMVLFEDEKHKDKFSKLFERQNPNIKCIFPIKINEGVCNVEDFRIVDGFLTGYSGCDKCINIPNSVTHICESAFSKCKDLVSINIPSSVVRINDYAFENCESLISISVPNSVRFIGDYAFSGCSSLIAINIPDSVTHIGHSAFVGCRSLSIVELPKNIRKIHGSTFAGCASLVSIDIPSNVNFIGNCAFQNCTSLVSVTLPKQLSEIRKSLFSGCVALKFIDVPSSVSKIGEYAFYNCKNLVVSYENENNIKEIGKRAFGRFRY